MLKEVKPDYWQVKVLLDGVVQLNASYNGGNRDRGPQFYAENATFLGATGNGSHPTAGHELNEMWFEVPAGDNQTWLFKCRGDKWRLLSTRWEDGKLRVYMGTDLPISVGKQHLEANIAGHTYVTDEALVTEPGKYRTIDPISLLQCLEGRISTQALARRAKKLQVEDSRDVKIRDLHAELEIRDRELQSARKMAQSAHDAYAELLTSHEIEQTRRRAIESDCDFWEAAAQGMWPVFEASQQNILVGAATFLALPKGQDEKNDLLFSELIASGRFGDALGVMPGRPYQN